MRCSLHSAVVLLTAMVHGLCALGGDGGVVFCIEADGCVRLEFGLEECCESESGQGTDGAPIPSQDDDAHVDDCEACLDVPLEVSEAPVDDQRFAVVERSDVEPKVSVLSALLPGKAETCAAASRSAGALLPEPGPLAAGRTIVLLI